MSAIGPYAEEISRPKPSCFIFMVDQSGSMSDPFGGHVEEMSNPSKAQVGADAPGAVINVGCSDTWNSGSICGSGKGVIS